MRFSASRARRRAIELTPPESQGSVDPKASAVAEPLPNGPLTLLTDRFLATGATPRLPVRQACISARAAAMPASA